MVRAVLVCAGVVAVAACAETGDSLFRKVPDAHPGDPSITVDASVDAGPTEDAPAPEADAAVDAEIADSALSDGKL
jgi:hypothetical protein